MASRMESQRVVNVVMVLAGPYEYSLVDSGGCATTGKGEERQEGSSIAESHDRSTATLVLPHVYPSPHAAPARKAPPPLPRFTGRSLV